MNSIRRLGKGRDWDISLLQLMNRLWLELRLSIHFASDWMRHTRTDQTLSVTLVDD